MTDMRNSTAAVSSPASPRLGGALTLGFDIPFGDAAARAARRRTGDHCLGRDPARRHRDHPRRQVGDGAGQLHRARHAGRRRARMRLEQGHAPNSPPRTRTSCATASGATCRPAAAAPSAARRNSCARPAPPRAHMLIAAAAAQWNVAAADCSAAEQRHHPCRRAAAARPSARSRQPPPTIAPPHEVAAQRRRGLEAARQAAATARNQRQGAGQDRSTASTCACPACCTPR